MDITQIISFFILLSLVSISAIYRLRALVWTALIGVALLLMSVYGMLPVRGLLFFWLCYLAAAGFAHLKQQRIGLITAPLLQRIKKQLPTISKTEQEAIDAGNTWWEKELFCGQPDWKQLLAMPTTVLTAEEQSFLDNQVETLCAMLNDWEITQRDNDLPKAAWDYLKKEKFLGMIIPKEYGGLAFSALAHSTVISKIATRSVSAAVNIMVPNSLGPAELLMRYGTNEQKQYYLPKLAIGEEIPCFALTAPHAGSDASNIPDTGIVCKNMYEGKEVVGIRLNWDKRYITLAPIATVLGLAIHLYDPENLLGDEKDIGITLCLIPTKHSGVEIGTRHNPMHMAFMNGPTRGNDVFIPLEWIIGGKTQAGRGWHMLMECLSIGRSISLPALSTASIKTAYRFTGAYARLRKQFNVSISAFEGIEEALGSIAGMTYLIEASRIMTASAIDMGMNPATASAIAKYHMTEMSRMAINHAMDIHAGHMVQTGPRNLIANLYMSAPISITVEGANILTRNLIIFGQGAIRCHPYLLKEIELMSAPNMNIEALDKVLLSHIGFFVSNLIRTLTYGVTGGHFIFASSKDKTVKKYERQLTRMSAGLAVVADACLILFGGSLKRRERISARLGDILSQLYLASAALKYFNEHDKTPEAKHYLRWSLQFCLSRMQTAFYELFNNFPNRWIGRLLKWCVFPLGYAYHAPDDKLTRKLVAQMTEPTPLREQLTRYCFISQDENELSRQLENALLHANEYDVLRKKLQKAVQDDLIPEYLPLSARIEMAEKAGVLTHAEAAQLVKFETLRDEIIKVNEFTFNMEEVVA